MQGRNLRGPAITSLMLAHFRSHRTLELTLDRRPLAIVGPNGAGKTNILEAVSLLSPGRGLRRAAPADLARRPELLGWKIRAEIDCNGTSHEIETWAEGTGSRQLRIDGKAATQLELARLLRILWLVPAMDRLWIEAAEGRRRFLDRMALTFFPDHARAALDYERAMRERNRLLREEITDPAWHGALEGRMSEAGALLTANRRATLDLLARVQQTETSAFPQAMLQLVEAEDWGNDLAAALTASRRRDMAAGRTLVGPHRSDLQAIYATKGIPADQCSTGEQKALLLSLILANARALAAAGDGPPVLLLDEVAAHLDTGRRAALYDAICALGAQALMTGTEAALFDSLGDRGLRLTLAADGNPVEMSP